MIWLYFGMLKQGGGGNPIDFMPHIFISYRRDDSAYVAGMLSQRLRAVFGADSVYIDIDAIPFGIDFREHIQNAVHKCDVLLAVIGKHWLSIESESGKRRIDDPADFVRIEIEAAIKRNIPVVPILIDNTAMPSAVELPEAIASLAFRNAAELRAGRDLDHHLELIVNGLRQLLKLDSTQVTSTGLDTKVAEGSAGMLRFMRDKSLSGSLFAFSIELDGHSIGQLLPGEILECPVSVGTHQLKVSHRGALFDASKEITVASGQTLGWDLTLGWTGAVKLSEH